MENKNQRQYLPTFSDLVDRMSICILKQVFIPEHAEEYKEEIDLIIYDIDLILDEHEKIRGCVTGTMIHAMLVTMLTNRIIWENESKARLGGSEQDKLLKFTHSVNGIRSRAKNVISNELGERKDLKVDSLAADLPKEFGNWNII